MRKKHLLILLFLAIGFIGCAGEDYTPVYFPSSQSESAVAKPPAGEEPSLAQAQCHLELTAKLCVKIKGNNIEVGTRETNPLCSDTPPIPLEIEGEKIILKGSDFPDVNVSVDIKGVATPMTINGKGEGDGSNNVGQGSWTPQGDILIQGFSFFINVLGTSGEIPKIDLTTDEAKAVSNLPSLKGKPADASGKITLVAATTLGHLFEAADEFLLGASLQASFEGALNPPLSECAKTAQGEKKIRIMKLRPAGPGQFLEEPLPEENLLEISKGTYIAKSEEDVGPLFEETAHFKAVNEGKEALAIEIPNQVGPFYFSSNGKTKTTLQPKKDILFQVTFRPSTETTPKAGPVKETFSLASSRFYLTGVALDQAGRLETDQIDETGQTVEGNIETLSMDPLSVPATPVKNYFQCQTISCSGATKITACGPCTSNLSQDCTLQIINQQQKPLDEVGPDCKPLYPNSSALMNLDLSQTNQIPLKPSKQVFTLHNQGIAPLEIKKIGIEEFPNSKSKGEFQLNQNSILTGTTLQGASAISLPVTLAPSPGGSGEKILFVTVAYLPTDLVGVDGEVASTAQAATDKAYLVIETNAGAQKILLIGKTKIQEIPPLQVLFRTPTGIKAKSSLETFPFEEVTQNTQDLAYPVFLYLSETATMGLRVTEIQISGEDQNSFEWLDTEEKVNNRAPPAGAGRRCSIEEQFHLNFVPLSGQGFDLKPGAYSISNPPLFGCVNFHPSTGSTGSPQAGSGQAATKKIFKADLTVQGLGLDSQGGLIRNPDNTFQQTTLTIHLAAAINPLKGKMVVRISQTVAALLNPQSPSLTAVAAKKEVDLMMREGRGQKELTVLLGALILDPFDEMTITDAKGNVVSEPGDGITAVFRQLDTRPSSTNYEEESLFDYTTLLDIFYDYDFPEHPLPSSLKVNGWRLFTGALSYPGPLSPRSPISRSECNEIDPCSLEGLRQFSESGVGSDGKGACAFFYASAGRYHSPAFEPVIRGEGINLCDNRDQPQDIQAMNNGHYSVDGSLTFEDLGLRFWGPNYVFNPYGPLGFKPPLDEVFHMTLTTELLKPPSSPTDYNLIPDEKIDLGKQEYKINLTETDLEMPPTCPKNTHNRHLGGRIYSSWRYFAPLLFKDEAAETPAGCPEVGTPFTGGTAYLKGRRIDPDTKTFTMVLATKFSSREELSSAVFQNKSVFVALNGWICDPSGSEENFEGAKCFDPEFNERDAKAQISIVEE